jgi:hypothetical protein
LISFWGEQKPVATLVATGFNFFREIFFRPQSSISQPELCPLFPALRGNRQGGMGVPPVLALVDAMNGIVCFPCSAIFWAESKKRMPPYGGIRFGIFTRLSWLSPFQRE